MYKVFFVVALSLFFYSCKNHSNAFVVEGSVKGMKDGKIYFIRSGDTRMIDTITVHDEHFTFKGTLTEPTVFMINFGSDQQPGYAILEPGYVSVNYTLNHSNSLKVSSGKNQELYNQFLEQCKPIFQSMDSIGQVAAQHEQDENFLNGLQSAFGTFDSLLKVKQLNFIKQNKSSVATAFIGLSYLNEKEIKTQEEIEALYNGLDNDVKQTYYGKKMHDMIQKVKGTAVGQAATDFTLPDISGKSVSLSSFKGKITLVDFWASWCGPCRAENPNVVNAYTKFHPKGFEVLGVSLDNQKDKWELAIKKDQLLWTQVSDLKGWESSVVEQYAIESIPSNVLLDANGTILAKNLRGEELEQKLAELFK